MKILNLRKRIAMLLVAIGVNVAPTAWAADLQTNLVVDGSFEEVDEGLPGPFTSLELLEWADEGEFVFGFAYPYDSNYSGNPAPPGSGDFHFTGGFETFSDEAEAVQLLKVDGGDSGNLIQGGNAQYDLSAFFSTYRVDYQVSRVKVTFLDGQKELGTDEIGGEGFLRTLPVPNGQVFWGQDLTTGILPVDTDTVKLEIIPEGDAQNFDGYVDLVDFRVGGLGDDFGLVLEVDPNNGSSHVKNLTGQPVDLNYYEIRSGSGDLKTDKWNSLQDQDLEGSGGTSGTGDGWEEAAGSSTRVLSELFLQSSSILADGADISLGAPFSVGGEQDLTFRYGLSNGLLLSGVVRFQELEELLGDTNQDGVLDAADIDFLYQNLGGDARLDLNGDGNVDDADVSFLVNDVFDTYLGDANLDGEFSTGDLVAIFAAGEYEDDVVDNSGWSEGDWNGDQDFDTGDLVAAFVAGGFEKGPRAAVAVPEPSGVLNFIFGCFCFWISGARLKRTGLQS